MNLKVIAIPFAGGNVYSYTAFNPIFPKNIIFKTFELPGRGERLSEPFNTDARSLAMDIFFQIENEITRGSYVIYGHSLGTLVGYELVKEIIRRNYPLPLELIFTGRAGPSVLEPDSISEYPSHLFWDEIESKGGTPRAISSNKEFRDFFEPILRSDFKVAESYVYVPMEKPFTIPIKVIAGTDERDITDQLLGTWQLETSFPLKKSFMSGNHFFIFEHSTEVVREIIKTFSVC